MNSHFEIENYIENQFKTNSEDWQQTGVHFLPISRIVWNGIITWNLLVNKKRFDYYPDVTLIRHIIQLKDK